MSFTAPKIKRVGCAQADISTSNKLKNPVVTSCLCYILYKLYYMSYKSYVLQGYHSIKKVGSICPTFASRNSKNHKGKLVRRYTLRPPEQQKIWVMWSNGSWSAEPPVIFSTNIIVYYNKLHYTVCFQMLVFFGEMSAYAFDFWFGERHWQYLRRRKFHLKKSFESKT